MLRRIRRWLNVKTWDQAHVPLEVDSHEGELRAQLLGLDAAEDYIELDRQIRHNEVGSIEAMTDFLQIGLNEKAMKGVEFTHDIVRKHETDTQERWVAKEAVKQTTTPASDLVRSDEPGGKGAYAFPVDPREHSPLAPRSAMLKPPRLTPDEIKAVGFVKDAKQISSLVEGFVPPKMKPALARKLKESEAGYQRVTIDAKGKTKKVKTKA